jgi:thioredoxin 1
MAPIVHDFAKKHPHVQVDEIDVDKSHEVAVQYGIQSIPTLIVFNDDGSIKEVIKGLVKLDAIEKACFGVYSGQ